MAATQRSDSEFPYSLYVHIYPVRTLMPHLRIIVIYHSDQLHADNPWLEQFLFRYQQIA